MEYYGLYNTRSGKRRLSLGGEHLLYAVGVTPRVEPDIVTPEEVSISEVKPESKDGESKSSHNGKDKEDAGEKDDAKKEKDASKGKDDDTKDESIKKTPPSPATDSDKGRPDVGLESTKSKVDVLERPKEKQDNDAKRKRDPAEPETEEKVAGVTV